MTKKIVKLPQSVIEAEVKISREEFEPYFKEALGAARAKVEIKGFRPGTAPAELAERAINENEVFEKAANAAVKNSLNEIVEENGLTLVAQPEIDFIPDAAGLSFKAKLFVFPEITLGDYRQVAKKIFGEKKEFAVTDEETEKSLGWLAASRAKITRVSREAQNGDVVNIVYNGFIGKESLKDASRKNDQFILGSGGFLPGFEDNLVGRREGETVKFSLTAPEGWRENLGGKKIDFEAETRGVFKRETPTLDDEFAKSLGNFASLDELKKSIKERILREKEETEKERRRAAAVNEIVGASKIDPPQVFIDKTIERLIGEAKRAAVLNLTTDGEKARLQIAAELAIHAIAERENLEPKPEEIEAEIGRLAERGAGNIDRKRLYDYSYAAIRNRKVFEFLENCAKNQ